MKKRKLPPAKEPLPEFGSDKEAAEYFQTHSVAEVWNQLLESEPAKASKALQESIRERHVRAKSPISIRLDREQIAAAKKIASTKSVGYQTQLRMWIAEGIRREAKQGSAPPVADGQVRLGATAAGLGAAVPGAGPAPNCGPALIASIARGSRSTGNPACVWGNRGGIEDPGCRCLRPAFRIV